MPVSFNTPLRLPEVNRCLYGAGHETCFRLLASDEIPCSLCANSLQLKREPSTDADSCSADICVSLSPELSCGPCLIPLYHTLQEAFFRVHLYLNHSSSCSLLLRVLPLANKLSSFLVTCSLFMNLWLFCAVAKQSGHFCWKWLEL